MAHFCWSAPDLRAYAVTQVSTASACLRKLSDFTNSHTISQAAALSISFPYDTIAPMALAPGTQLGPYEILAQIGAGGMREVYRAHDPRLNRDVAIKVSHAQFTERFEREARAVAALNHPNICTLYDVGP